MLFHVLLVVEVVETPRSWEKDRTAVPALCMHFRKRRRSTSRSSVRFVTYILSGLVVRIDPNRRLAKLQAVIEAVIEYEFGARRPEGK